MKRVGSLELVNGSIKNPKEILLAPLATPESSDEGRLYYDDSEKRPIIKTDVEDLILVGEEGTRHNKWSINTAGNVFTLNASNVPVGGIEVSAEKIVTVDGQQILTNKTIDATQLTGTIDSALLPADVVLTTATQTLSNKSIDSTQLTGDIEFDRVESIVGQGELNIARGNHNHAPHQSHLGLEDFEGSGILPFPSSPIAIISDPDGDYKVLTWEGESHVVINDGSITYQTPDKITDLHTGTILSMELTDSDGTVIFTDTLTCDQSPAQISTGGKISTSQVDESLSGKYEGFVSFTVDYNTLAAGGYIKVHVNQRADVAAVITDYPQEVELVYDNGTTPPVIDSVNITPNTLNSAKWLSGVQYYSNADTFDIDVQCSNAYDKSFPSSIATLNCSEFGINLNNINYTDGNITGVSNPPHYDEVLTYDNDGETIVQSYVIETDARISCTVKEPFANSSTVYSPSQNMLVNTYPTSSTEVYETFLDEFYRLDHTGLFDTFPGVINNVYDSTKDIGNITNYDGTGLQVYAGNLVYPTIDFSTGYLPIQSVDYSSLSGDRYYTRVFKDPDGDANSNCILRIGGISFNDLDYNNGSRPLKIEIRLSGAEAYGGIPCPWLDIGRAFNAADFPDTNNGCLLTDIAGSGYIDLSLTFGQYTTADSDFGFVLRVTALDQNMPAIEYVQVTNW